MDENEVIASTCYYLENAGYQIVKRCNTKERGVDIIAKHPSRSGHFLIEAKGGTSSIKGTKRYGKPFSHNQLRTHTAVGLYTAICLRCNEQTTDDEIGLAYPNIPKCRELIDRIKPALDKLKITVFFVNKDRTVLIA